MRAATMAGESAVDVRVVLSSDFGVLVPGRVDRDAFRFAPAPAPAPVPVLGPGPSIQVQVGRSQQVCMYVSACMHHRGARNEPNFVGLRSRVMIV